MVIKKEMKTLVRKHSTQEAHVSGAFFSFDNVPGSSPFKIGWNKYFSFWKEYCEMLDADPKIFESSNLYEYNTEETSLRFTFSFNFTKRSSDIRDSVIEIIIPVIREAIFDNLQLDSTEIIACISSSRGGNNFILDFHFPGIRVQKDNFNKSILPDFCDKLREAETRKELPEFKGGDWEDILLKLTEYSPVYGCKFSRDDNRLHFIGMWSDSGAKIEDDISDCFTAKKHSLFKTHCQRQIGLIDEEKTDYTPVIISSRYSGAITCPKIDETVSKFSYATDISSDSEVDMVYHLMPLLSKERFNNPMYRRQVGRCIFNIFNKEINGLEFFNTFCSREVHKHNMEDWEDLFPNDTGVNDFLSVRTIGYFAKMDDPDGYQSWHSSWMNEAISKSLGKIEIDVAEVMYRYLWLDFTTVGNNEWYRFSSNGTRLIRSIANVDFQKKFPDLISFYSGVLMDSSSKVSSLSHTDSPDTKTRDSAIDKTKTIGEIMKKLGTISYQRAIEKHCFAKFYRHHVDKYFDTNPSLMCWSNCVSEVCGNEIYTRSGKMEDFITMSSDISYIFEDYDWEHPKIKEVLYWFEQVFVTQELIHYFLKICASFLYGRNSQKEIYAFCGSGNNSKSMIQLLFERLFSVYCINFPVSVLTDNRQNSSGPSPELVQAKGAHIANIAEPDSKIPFMGSLMKRYSGGDTFFARGNHKDGGNVEAMFKMILYCNAVPRIEGADSAVENRLRVVPFLSTFCDDAPDNEDLQFEKRKFPLDSHFEKKINLFRKPFLWIIMNYFPMYMEEGVKPPEIVVEYTKKYWEENDPYKLFLNENLIKTESDGDKINATNLYKIFKQWFASNFNAKKEGIPDLSAMVRHLSAVNLMGEPKSRVWSGWRIQMISQDNSMDKGPRKHNID